MNIEKIEKIKTLPLDEIVKIKEMVNEIVLRTHITGNPSPKWKDFNEFLMLINKIIEDRIYDEFIA